MGVQITARTRSPHRLQAGERVHVPESNSARCWRTDSSSRISCISPSKPTCLATKVRTVGIDYLSVGGYRSDGAKVHKILLQAGIWIIEGLDLSPVAAAGTR